MHNACGKVSYPALRIEVGPKSCEDAPKFYKRQCCGAPLPKDAVTPTAGVGQCGECESNECDKCGWERAMPTCRIEYTDDEDAEWKVYRPRVEADGKSYRDELTTVTGTRKEFMAVLKKLFNNWSPHDWVYMWTTHMRHLTYATFRPTEMIISTDFSAQIELFCTDRAQGRGHSHMRARTAQQHGRVHCDALATRG